MHQRYKTANGFRTRRNYHYIWPITLLELRYIIISARNAAAIAKGMVKIEVHSFLLKGRESTLAARSEVLEMLEVKGGTWFGRLDDDSRRSSGRGACILELTTCRHRGAVVILRQPS